MAKILIEIEDTSDGKVRVTSTPNFETMMKMNLSGETLTSAHGYAFACLNAVRTESKKNSSHILTIPKIGRP